MKNVGLLGVFPWWPWLSSSSRDQERGLITIQRHDDDANVARFEVWARERVHMGDGIIMLSEQSANSILRHCRIGKVTRKAA